VIWPVLIATPRACVRLVRLFVPAARQALLQYGLHAKGPCVPAPACYDEDREEPPG